MPTPTVIPTRPVVKLSDPGMVAGIGRGERLYVQYQAKLQTSLDLDDAIKMAQMVLRYAEANGIDVSRAGSEVGAMPQDWWEDQEAELDGDGYEPRF